MATVVRICERCEEELETAMLTNSNANIGMRIAAFVRLREGKFDIRVEQRKPFWLCLNCAREFQKWVANKKDAS